MPASFRLVLCAALATLGLGCLAVAGPEEECPCPSSVVPQASLALAALPIGECR